MSAIYESAEKALLERQKLPTNLGPEAVRPAYEGLSLANVPALATALLAPDAPTLHTEPALPALNPALLGLPEVNAAWQKWLAAGPVNHVVILLMDALGYDQLVELVKEGRTPNLAKAIASQNSFFMPLTSVYPSTTTNALTSVATAYAPAQHGVMATSVYMRELGSVVDVIGFAPAVSPVRQSYNENQLNPETFVPVPNVYQRLEQAGIQCETVNYYMFKGTSISRFTSAGSQAGSEFYNGYLTPADGFAQLRERLKKNSAEGRKSFTYAYVPNVDSSAHRYAPLSFNYKAEVATLDFSLERELFAPLAGRSDIAILLVADHGQRSSYNEKVFWIQKHPELARKLLVPITGESRAGFLFTRHGQEQAVVDYIEREVGEHFALVPKNQAIELGLFGLAGQPLGLQCEERIGDLVLIPKTDWVAKQLLTNDVAKLSYIGVHGGLSRAEMLIPFLATRL